MKHGLILISILVVFIINGISQEKINLKKIIPDSLQQNITVQKLKSDKQQSSFLIWVRDTVKPHYHKYHSESIYVLEGEGIFYLGSKKMNLVVGDYILIPQGIIHSYKNQGTNPSKILSIQAPKFAGKDRIWVDKQE